MSKSCLILDDNIDFNDSNYFFKREKINNLFNKTIKSRLLHSSAPIVIILSKLSNDDILNA